MAHNLTTHSTTAEIEARDTTEDPFTFLIDNAECDGRYDEDKSVILKSADGDTFMAHITETDYERMCILIEVD
jgi:hypothetical protein